MKRQIEEFHKLILFGIISRMFGDSEHGLWKEKEPIFETTLCYDSFKEIKIKQGV